MHVMIGAGRPALAADLSGRRQGFPPPYNLAGLGVERGQPPAHAIFTAGDPAIDDAVIVERGAGDPIAVLPYLDRRLPQLLARLAVERDDIGVELAEEQHAFADRQSAIVPAAAHARQLLVDARPAFPQELTVFAFSAKTSSLPVTIYMTPSLTRGVASNEYFPPTPEPLRRVIQAPLSCLMLLVSICFSVE